MDKVDIFPSGIQPRTNDFRIPASFHIPVSKYDGLSWRKYYLFDLIW